MGFIYKGKIIELKTKKVYFTDGHSSLFEFALHQPGVVIVPLLKNNKILLVKQYRPVVDKKLWEVPAGIINKNETPLHCAKRELEEETGLIPQKMIKLGSFYSSPGFTNEKTTCFLAKEFIHSKQKLDPDEMIEIGYFSFTELLKKIKSNKIIDAKTVLSILIVKYLIDNN